MTKTILLVDDDSRLREVMREVITHWHGSCQVEEARNGREAVDLAQALRPDVIVMDINMPELNGVEAMQQIKDSGVLSKMIVCTSCEDQSILDKARQAGASAIIAKPFDLAQFYCQIF